MALETDTSAPALAQAVSLGLGVLRTAKVDRWAELDGELPPGLDLTDEQLDLIHRHEPVLTYIQTAARSTSRSGGTESTLGSPGKTVTVAVCPDCGRWVLVGGGASPPRCSMNIACSGKPVKASAARIVRD